MSKLVKFFAAVALVCGLFAFAPGAAEAQRHGWHGGGWHGGGGWHRGGWHGGWHGGRRGWRGGGWGWGPAIGLGIGTGWGWGWGAPYGYYASDPWVASPSCGWVRVRSWRHGHWVIRRAWRCW